jgi:hypothetical protein
MQRCTPEVMRQKQEVLLNLFAELSQERLDSLVGLVRLVAAVPDKEEGLRSLSLKVRLVRRDSLSFRIQFRDLGLMGVPPAADFTYPCVTAIYATFVLGPTTI